MRPNKTSELRVRISDKDKDVVSNAAAKLDMTVSEFVRHYIVLMSSTVDDYTTGAIELDDIGDILQYDANYVLKSVKREE